MEKTAIPELWMTQVLSLRRSSQLPERKGRTQFTLTLLVSFVECRFVPEPSCSLSHVHLFSSSHSLHTMSSSC